MQPFFVLVKLFQIQKTSSTLSRAQLGYHLDTFMITSGRNNSRKWLGVLKVKLNRAFSCRDARAVNAPEPNRTGYLNSAKHISNVATSQTKGDAGIRKPSVFRFSQTQP